MPRPENPELKNEILAQARGLFRAKGYRATSYADIARAAGTTKGLLQYYFPRKDQIATTLMTEVLERAQAALGYVEPPEPGSAEACRQLYRIGQLFFGYLLEGGAYARFLQDITSDLDLVEDVLAFNIGWALGYAQLAEHAGEREVVEGIVMTMGGFYALLHYDLTHGFQMDVRRHLRVVMREFMHATGFSEAEETQALDDTEFADAELRRALARMR